MGVVVFSYSIVLLYSPHPPEEIGPCQRLIASALTLLNPPPMRWIFDFLCMIIQALASLVISTCITFIIILTPWVALRIKSRPSSGQLGIYP